MAVAKSTAPQICPRVRVGDYARSWLARRRPHLASETARAYAAALEDHILPVLGDAYYDMLRAADVQDLVNRWMAARRPDTREPYSADAIRFWFRVLRTMTSYAIDDLELARDCCRKIQLPRRRNLRSEKRALTPEEERRLLEWYAARRPDLYPLAFLMAVTGLRFAHASVLRWADIDATAGVIRPRLSRYRGGAHAIRGNKRAPEYLPLVPQLASVLNAHRRAALRDNRERRDSTAEGANAPVDAFGVDWCFPAARTNQPVLYCNWQRAWRQALSELRITVARYCGPHAFRRSFVDMIRHVGVSEQLGRAFTAHASAEQYDGYASFDTAELATAVTAVNGLLATSPAARSRTASASAERENGTKHSVRVLSGAVARKTHKRS